MSRRGDYEDGYDEERRRGSRYPDDYGTDGYGSGGKRKKSGAGSVISTIVLIIAIGVFAYSGYRLYSYWREYKAGQDEYSDLNKDYVRIDPETGAAQDTEDGGVILTSVEELENEKTLQEKIDSAKKEETEENSELKVLPEMRNPVDFDELLAINEEVVGWIRVGGCGISYPVVQADNNDYYLHRTFRREEVFSGSIFENCDNSKYFTDQNTILYGHNMKDGSMFASLRKFWEDPDAISNPYFWVFTPKFIYQYRIFSCSVVSKIGDPYRVRFSTDDFRNFIDTSKKATEVDVGDVNVTTDDRIVTLSTCTGDDATRRIVQGKLIQVYIAK